MKRCAADKKVIAHNILSNGFYTKESGLYQLAYKGLCKLTFEELDALHLIVVMTR